MSALLTSPAAIHSLPANYNIGYLFAITMAAQPLAWFVASGLSEKQTEEHAPLIKKNSAIAVKIQASIILPIGDEFNGRSWTEFQSIIAAKESWIIVYRENNPQSSRKIKQYIEPNMKVCLQSIISSAKNFTTTSDSDGRAEFVLAAKNSFALFHFTARK